MNGIGAIHPGAVLSPRAVCDIWFVATQETRRAAPCAAGARLA